MAGPDRRRQRGTETRARLVNEALALIGEEGVPGLTAGALAKRAGVSKATIFHHFCGLDRVVHAALDALVAQMMATATADARTASAWLLSLGLESFRALKAEPTMVAAAQAFLVAGTHDEGLRVRMAQVSIAARQHVAAELQRRAPDTPEDAVREIADASVAILDGIGMHLLLTGEEQAFLEAWRHTAGMLAENLVERRSTGQAMPAAPPSPNAVR